MYVCENRYETATKNADETKETKTEAFSNATLDGFGEQDPFATNKAKEAFNASDPFESDPFSAQPSNVRSFHLF